MALMSIESRLFADGHHIRREIRHHVLSTLWRALAARARSLAAAYAERRRVRRAVAELAGLSSRTLKDIGVERHDIERIVRYGRDWTERPR
jgi:uncharacterized protein YjiS (DUF1127 family)